MSRMPNEYKNTQVGTVQIVSLGSVLLILFLLSVVSDYSPIFSVGMIVMLLALGCFASLTVTVDERMARIKFGLGIIRKRFPLNEIHAHRGVKNRWFYGWGIRYTPHGWLFNVSGLSAVELEMTSGKTYRIGTNDPEGLAAALDRALSGRAAQ